MEENETMHLKIVLTALLFFPITLAAQETLIENEYKAYLDDFMAFDLEGIASHFTTPTMVIGASTQVRLDEDAIKDAYRAARTNIQNGYAYSKSSLEITQVTNKIYCVTNTFTRHNDADEVLFEGTSYNFFKETKRGWKLFLIQSAENGLVGIAP